MRPLRDVGLEQLRQLFEKSERVVRVYRQDTGTRVRYLALFPEKPFPDALDEDASYKYRGTLDLATGAVIRDARSCGQDEATTGQDAQTGRAVARGLLIGAAKAFIMLCTACVWLLFTLATAISGRGGRGHRRW